MPPGASVARGVGSFYKYIACMVINHHDQPKWGTEAPSGTEKELGLSRTDMGFGLCGGQPKWSTKMMNRATYGTEKEFRLTEVWPAWVNRIENRAPYRTEKKKRGSGSSRTDVGYAMENRAPSSTENLSSGSSRMDVAFAQLCRQWFGVNRVPGDTWSRQHVKKLEFNSQLLVSLAPVVRTPESHLRGVRQSRIKIWNFGLRYQFIRIKIVKFWTRFVRKFG